MGGVPIGDLLKHRHSCLVPHPYKIVYKKLENREPHICKNHSFILQILKNISDI